MLVKESIGVRQLAVLVTIMTIGDSLLVLPSITAVYARQDAWISSLLGLLIGLPAVYLLGWIHHQYPKLTLYQYSDRLLGKAAGTCLTMLYLIYFFLNAAVLVREIGDFTVTHFMRNTPIQAVHILYISIIVMGVRLGLEALARTGEIFFPWFWILFLILVICIAPQIDPRKLQPVFEHGLKPVLQGSLAATAYPYLEISSLLAILPFVKQENGFRSSLLWGALLGGTAVSIFITLSIFVLGMYMTKSVMYPGYLLAQKISIGHFLERIEASLAIMWIITTYFKVTLNYFALLLGLSHLLKLQEYKMLALPMAMILLVFSIFTVPNITYYIQLDEYWPFADFTFSVLFPLLLLGVHALRTGRRSKA